MISFPFESKNIGSKENEIWDRAITAQMERKFNKLRYTNGVFVSPANSLMVEAAGGMKVRVNPGGCHIEGALATEDLMREIPLAPSSSSLPRIDRVVARFDTSDSQRNIEIYLKQGAPATYPSPPDIIRQDNYYELVLADITVPKGVTSITNANIFDRRLDKDLCGWVVPAIPYRQYQDELWKQIKEATDIVMGAFQGTAVGDLSKRVKANEDNLIITQETKTAMKAIGWKE